MGIFIQITAGGHYRKQYFNSDKDYEYYQQTNTKIVLFFLNLFLDPISVGVEDKKAGEDGDEGESGVEGFDEMKIEAGGQKIEVGKGEDEEGHEEEGGEEFDDDGASGALLG